MEGPFRSPTFPTSGCCWMSTGSFRASCPLWLTALGVVLMSLEGYGTWRHGGSVNLSLGFLKRKSCHQHTWVLAKRRSSQVGRRSLQNCVHSCSGHLTKIDTLDCDGFLALLSWVLVIPPSKRFGLPPATVWPRRSRPALGPTLCAHPPFGWSETVSRRPSVAVESTCWSP